MEWSDERWVKLYLRDTPDWILWPWEARALLPLLLRKCDRAGLIDLGAHAARGLAALVMLPLEIVERGLAALVDDGCVTMTASGSIIVRSFIEAQESRTSNHVRQAEYRARRRTQAADPVTPNDTALHVVTASDAPLQVVADSNEQSRQDKSRTEQKKHTSSDIHQADLDAAYARYPRREGKSPGMKIAKREIRTAADLEQFNGAVDEYAATMLREGREKKYILTFPTFMGRWRDFLPSEDDMANKRRGQLEMARLEQACRDNEESGEAWRD